MSLVSKVAALAMLLACAPAQPGETLKIAVGQRGG